LAEIDGALEPSAEWVFELEGRLGWRDRRKVYLALLGTLHALRDSLPLDEAVFLAAEFPALLRGLYYEGWHPHERPAPLDDRETFLNRVHEAVHRDPGIDAEQVVRTVFGLLAERISAPEFEDVRAASPEPLHGLWPR
jgi:uncharacterized protein (DUF2267 family)